MDLITVNHKEFLSKHEVQEEVVAEIEDIEREMETKFKSVFWRTRKIRWQFDIRS